MGLFGDHVSCVDALSFLSVIDVDPAVALVVDVVGTVVVVASLAVVVVL